MEDEERRNMNRVECQAKLASPFLPEELDVRGIQHTQDGTKAVPFFYLNARAVMDRLEDVFGLTWSYSTELLSCTPEKVAYKATISVNNYGQGLTISRDGIGEADVMWNKDGNRVTNDPHKSAESDALKRAAVSMGIGRYLYSVPTVWLPWSEESAQKRQWGKFVDDPRDFMFEVDGTVKATAIARDTKGKAQRVAATHAQPVAPASAPTSRKRTETPVEVPAPDVDATGAPRRQPPVTVIQPVESSTSIAKAITARRGAPSIVEAAIQEAAKPVVEKSKPTGKEAPSDYFIDYLNSEGIEFDPFATKTELFDDLYNQFAPNTPKMVSAKQIGFIVSLCDELDLDYPETLFAMTTPDGQTLIQALMKQKADAK